MVNVEMNLFWIGLGLAALGYFIGDGLKNFKNPKGSYSGYPYLIKEDDLHYYLGLSKVETKEMLRKYPDIPKIEFKWHDLLSVSAIDGLDVVRRPL